MRLILFRKLSEAYRKLFFYFSGHHPFKLSFGNLVFRKAPHEVTVIFGATTTKKLDENNPVRNVVGDIHSEGRLSNKLSFIYWCGFNAVEQAKLLKQGSGFVVVGCRNGFVKPLRELNHARG